MKRLLCKHSPGGYLEDGVSGERRVSVALQKKSGQFSTDIHFSIRQNVHPTHLARIVSYEEELSVGREGIPLKVVPPLKRRLCKDEGFGRMSLELQEHMGAWRYVSRPRGGNVCLFDVMEFSFRTVSLSFMHQSPFVVASPSESVIDISKFGYEERFPLGRH